MKFSYFRKNVCFTVVINSLIQQRFIYLKISLIADEFNKFILKYL